VVKKENYFDQVYQVVQLIPKGRATSYGAISNYLGIKGGARIVGWAMNAAHTLSEVPAHRVTNRNGYLTGKMHFSSPSEMQERLENEGIKVIEDQIQDWNSIFWDPMLELL
jgi:methylated-DNA-protein-cysteine methyltransferase-like protein